MNKSLPPVHRFILLTDIAGSSRLAEVYPVEYANKLAKHNSLIEAIVTRHGGSVYKNTGDGYFALFGTAGACVDCATELATALAGIDPLVDNVSLQVRIALHAGELQPTGAEFFGPALNRASRICQVCNPEQVLCSGAVVSALGKPSEGLQLHDLGSHHLRDLDLPERLYHVDHTEFENHVFPPLSTLENRPNNLVTQPNAFIGRSNELTELAGLLHAGKRLITIIAPGGYGKSRLAAQLCANQLHHFERGAFMAYLAPMREAIDVPGGIANALSFQFSAGRTPEQQLCDFLRDKQLLLCLDNFEHVLDCAPLVAQFLKEAPRLKIIVTSREPLRIEGEQTYVLDPLKLSSTAGEYSDAEMLFADRAMLVNRNFTLSQDNAAQVQHFCEHLAGIPLAIELAAAWMDSFTLDELHDELTNQFELEARRSDLAPRHQSLKACLDWSWNLLGTSQQEMLMRLSVFRGGFFIEAASAMLNLKGMALRSALARLGDKSWLYTREVDSKTRFFMRDMLAHEYAFEKLKETRGPEDSLFEQAVAAHATYFARLVKRESPNLNGGGVADGGAAQLAAMGCWRIELENINEALDSALRRDESTWLLPIAQYLWEYLDTISEYSMQRERYNLLLAAARKLGEPALIVHSQMGLGRAHWRLGDFSAARAPFEQSMVMFREMGDRRGEAGSLSNLGTVNFSEGEYASAAELYSRALAIRREIGDRLGEASSIYNLGLVHSTQYEFAQAVELQNQSVVMFREIGDRWGEANSLHNLGNVHGMQGEYARAAELFSQSLAIYRLIGDRRGEANSLGNLANVRNFQGEYALAAELLIQSAAISREVGARGNEAIILVNLGLTHILQGEYSSARAHLEQSLAICCETGDRPVEAYCLIRLAIVNHHQDRHTQSAQRFSEVLVIRRELDARAELALTCTLSAAALAALGELHSAVVALNGGQLQAAAHNYKFEPEESNLIADAQTRLDSAVSEGAISADELHHWQTEGEAMNLDKLVEFIINELQKVHLDS